MKFCLYIFLIFYTSSVFALDEQSGDPTIKQIQNNTTNLMQQMSSMLDGGNSDSNSPLKKQGSNVELDHFYRHKKISIPSGTVSTANGINKFNTSIDKMISFGFTNFNSGNIETSLYYYKQATITDPSHIEALFGTGVCYQMLGQADQAIKAYMSILAIEPESYPAKNNLIVLIAGKSVTGAIDELVLISQQYPHNAFILAQIGTLYSYNMQYKESIEYLGRAIQNDASNPLYTYNMAITLDKMGQHKDAYAYYEHTISLLGPSVPLDKSVIVDRMAYIKNKDNKS